MSFQPLGLKLISQRNHDSLVSKQAMEACEYIITEMGAEIHDDLVQKLYLLQLTLKRLEQSASDPIETEKLHSKIQTDLALIIQSVRRISRRLMPVSNQEGTFNQQVEMLCQNLEQPGAQHIAFSFEGPERVLTVQSGMYLLRIIQELIHNAFKHSSAWHIWVRVIWKETAIIIEVEDDGIGFAKFSEVLNRLKSKYNSLRMRADAIGASIQYIEGKRGVIGKVHLTF